MAYLPLLFRIQELQNRRKLLLKSIADAERNTDLTELNSRKTEYGGKLASLNRKLASIQKCQQQLNLELKACDAKILREETKLYDGSVINARELTQIQMKLAEYANYKRQIEEQILKLMEDEEKLSDLKAKIANSERIFRQKLTSLTEEVKGKILEYQFELNGCEAELNELTAKVPEEWLEKLEKIARSHQGIGIAQIKAGCCGACHVSLSESLLQKAKRGEDILLTCENCGRLIFY